MGHADTVCGLPSAGWTPGWSCCLSWLPHPPALEPPGHPAGPSEGGLTTAMTMFLVVRAKGGRGTFPCALATLTTPCEVATLQKRGLRPGPGLSATWRGQDVSVSQGSQNKGPQVRWPPAADTCPLSAPDDRPVGPRCRHREGHAPEGPRRGPPRRAAHRQHSRLGTRREVPEVTDTMLGTGPARLSPGERGVALCRIPFPAPAGSCPRALC